MNIRVAITVICLLCSAFPSLVSDAGRNLHAAISIDHFSAETNDRFANDAEFVGAGLDFSGVGRTTNSRWATLIAPNIFLTAQHFPPAIDQVVYFYRDNDPASTPVTRTVVGGQKLLDSDLRIGHFDLPVPFSITEYPFEQTFVTTENFESTIYNEFAIQLGNSPTASDYGADTRTNMAIGHNRIEQFTPDTSEDDVTGDVLWLIHNEVDDVGFDYEHYEAELFPNDSGSPVFTTDGGQLKVAGIAWAKGDIEIDLDPLPGPDHENLVERVGSIYTYTGNFTSQINDYIDDHVVMRLPGDYNANGAVDTADFSVWRDNLGSTTQLDADGNRNGIIDEIDYDIWRANFATSETGLPGDYNDSGIVDAADFTVWRDNLGSTTQLDADGNRNGIIDESDYGIWLANFSRKQTLLGDAVSVSTAADAAVPEPAVLWMLLSGSLCLVPFRQLLLGRVKSRQ